MFTFSLKDPFFLPHLGCDIDLLIQKGETFFLTGENGLGKSTLLKKMSDSLPDSYLLSQIPLDSFYDRSLRRFSSIAVEAFAGNLELETFQKLWYSFGLNLKMDRLLSHLSGGERQCVKLATGLSMRSSLLLLDEPSQYLDQEKKTILFKELSHLNRLGKSLVIVEHDLSWWKKETLVIPLEVHEKTLKKGSPWTIS